MASDGGDSNSIISDYPGLKPFVLSDVTLTGHTIGGGAYGQVEEVTVPVQAAGKRIHDALIREAERYAEPPKAVTQFVRECHLMSTLRHPNIVQFLGVAFLPGSRLPTLVMEKLITNLHDLLDSSAPQSPGIDPLSFFSLALRVSVLQNVASGLSYLHERPEPIIHRDLSGRNILIDSNIVAKIADLGVARIVAPVRAEAFTIAPGAAVFMPPEAYASKSSLGKNKQNYDTSIDVFSLGVLTIFTIGGVFPGEMLPANYTDENGELKARTEFNRRGDYMRYVNERLRTNGQLRGDHPLIRLIQKSLHNEPSNRPTISRVIAMLDAARAGIFDKNFDDNKRQLINALLTKPSNPNLDCIFRDLVTQNSYLLACLQAKDREIASLLDQIKTSSTQPHLPRYVCQLSGQGKSCATVNHSTKLIIELSESSGARSSMELNVTAQLEYVKKSPFARQPSTLSPSNTPVNLTVNMKTTSCYEVQYTPVHRGSYKITIRVNGEEVFGSPVTIVVYPDPNKIEHPVRSITGLGMPYCCAFNLQEDLICSEMGEHRLAVFASRRQLLRSVSCQSDDSNEMIAPRDIAIDATDNIYVTSRNKLQKFTGGGELIQSVGCTGKNEGEFSDPRGVTLHENHLYVGDLFNHRIQVFDRDLKFVRTFGQHGQDQGEFDEPIDIQFDESGKMYVAEWGNGRVQVMDTSGHYIRSFGEGILRGPSGLFIAERFIYVSDMNRNCITVFELESGNLVTTFGTKVGEIRSPYGIIGDNEGYLYICDSGNNRIQIF